MREFIPDNFQLTNNISASRIVDSHFAKVFSMLTTDFHLRTNMVNNEYRYERRIGLAVIHTA